MIKGHGDDAYLFPHITSNFSSNICPTRNAPLVMEHLASMPELVGHYPEPEAWSLERMIADTEHLEPENVLVTNGATEAIYLIAQAFRMAPAIPQPTFSEYQDACSMFPPEDASRRILWLCNPNNPTGCVYEYQFIAQAMRDYDFVVVDQSYEYYTDCFVLPANHSAQRRNLILIHSFTKTFGVPGLRLGYITANESLISYLRHYMRPWSVSALSIEAGKFLMQHIGMTCFPDMNEAQRLRDHLAQIPGILTHETHTNFMLCQLQDDSHTAADLKQYLAREHHMLIRDASNFQGLTPQHFRVAAQSPRENDALVRAIAHYVQNVK